MTEMVLHLDNVTKSFDDQVVLRGITADVGPGEVVGLLGLNGSGKTTLLEAALGFSGLDGGSATVFGAESFELHAMATKARIGFVPQVDEIIGGISGRRYLELIASFYDTWNTELVAGLCCEWDVPLQQRINTLSVGQKQKLALLPALGHEPDLLILDEPVATLDPLARRQFLTQLVDITADRDCTIVFSTHIVSDLERVASRVWLLKDGRLAVDESLDALKEETAKIHLPAETTVPRDLLGSDLIHHHDGSHGQTLVVGNWNPERHRGLASAVGLALDEDWRLSLEDIFLEVHR